MGRNGMKNRKVTKDTGRKYRKKPCLLCIDDIEWVDYKDVDFLKRYVSERGKIKARRVTGNCTQHQHDIAIAVKTAREVALLPYAQRVSAERTGTRRQSSYSLDMGDILPGDGERAVTGEHMNHTDRPIRDSEGSRARPRGRTDNPSRGGGAGKTGRGSTERLDVAGSTDGSEIPGGPLDSGSSEVPTGGSDPAGPGAPAGAVTDSDITDPGGTVASGDREDEGGTGGDIQ